MKLAGIDLGEKPLLLAPMEDVSDSSFRLICRRFGAAMVYSEFVSADALIRAIPGAERKLTIHPEEKPAVIQIYGRDVQAMVDAAKRVEEVEPAMIDINFGCPVKRVAGKGAGSGMLRNVPLMLEITQAVVRAVKTPVSVKTRLGWDHNSIIIEELAEALQDCGIVALTIHGRTRSDMYTGQADWEPIARVKQNPRISIPIIGNGDVTTGREALNAFNRYGVDAVMVGRASVGRPWVFQEMRSYIDYGEERDALTSSQKLNVLKAMVQNNIERLDERRGILHSRRHLAATPLFKGIPNFRPLRIEMLRATRLDELLATLEKIRPLITAEETAQ